VATGSRRKVHQVVTHKDHTKQTILPLQHGVGFFRAAIAAPDKVAEAVAIERHHCCFSA
jgi:uncharacterized protein YbgA (DUF1722 family)